MKGKKKHKYHLVKNENTGFNSIYDSMKKKRAIDVHDYIFLAETCDLSKKDKSLFRSKVLTVEGAGNGKYTDNQYFSWYSDFIARMGRIPLLKDYFEFEDLISSY